MRQSAREPENNMAKLDQIEAALRRMDRGTFGFCVSCTGQISLNRLMQDPTVKVCHTCHETYAS